MSQYKKTGVRNFYLEEWNPIEIDTHHNDREVTISSRFHLRPDLFAYEHLGDQNLWWVLPIRNPDLLINPINDFTAGKTIIVPAKEVVGKL